MKQIESTLSAEVESDIEFVLASLDSAHDTPEVLKKFKNEKSLDENWTLLHGDEMAVRNLAAVLGMKFKQTDNGKDFSHSAILTVLDSKGRINHQRLGFGSSVEETLEQVKLLISSN